MIPHPTRRTFLQAASALAVTGTAHAEPVPAELKPAVDKPQPYFTPPAQFQDVSRGKPVPHSLPEQKRQEVGLTRVTWRLEVIPDPDKPATLGKPLTKKDGTALDFATLLKLGER